jgi:hypothetical protein
VDGDRRPRAAAHSAQPAPVTSARARPGSGMTSRLSVRIGVYVAVGQTVALGIASVLTGSAALKTQTGTNLADVAVGVFLLIGVVTGDRPADDRHPLGHGRERFFWSFVAAVGIFIGGVGAAAVETLQAITRPQPTGSYLVGYAVLAVVIGLDIVALTAGARSVSAEAGLRRVPVRCPRRCGPRAVSVVLGRDGPRHRSRPSRSRGRGRSRDRLHAEQRGAAGAVRSGCARRRPCCLPPALRPRRSPRARRRAPHSRDFLPAAR